VSKSLKKSSNLYMNFVKSLIFGIIISTVTFFCALGYVKGNSNNITHIFLQQYGNLFIKNDSYSIEVAIFLLPHFYLLYIWGQETSIIMTKFGAYIFTRTDKRSNWIINRYAILGLRIFIYYIFQFLVTLILGIALGFKLYVSIYFLQVISFELLMVTLSAYLIILLSNTLSLIVDFMYSFTMVIFLEVASLCYCHLVYSLNLNCGMIKYIPFCQGVFLWHDSNLLHNAELSLNSSVIKDFSLVYSVSYLLFLIFIVIFCSNLIIKKIDVY